MHGMMKVLLELGPLVLFFVVFTVLAPSGPSPEDILATASYEQIGSSSISGSIGALLEGHSEAVSAHWIFEQEIGALIWASVAFFVSLVASLIVTYVVAREISRVAVFTAAVVFVTGGLTIYLHSEIFVKMKPTVVYSFFAIMLLYGVMRHRSYLKEVFGEMIDVTEQGWLKLSRNWGFFFVFCAGLNEFIWRVYSTETWVLTKTFVYVPLIVVFAMAQAPLLAAYASNKDAEGGEAQPTQ